MPRKRAGDVPDASSQRQEETPNPLPTVLAHWREAGEWWAGEPQREVVRLIDASGIRREVSRELPTLGKLGERVFRPEDENYREEWTLRLRKTRDEKVMRACGMVPKERILGEPDTGGPASPREEVALDAERASFRSEYGMRNRPPLEPSEAELRVAEDLAPYGLSRKDIGRARRLRSLRNGGSAPCGRSVADGLREEAHLTLVASHRGSRFAGLRQPPVSYVPLHVYSGYAFGRGTMLAEEIPLICASVGLPAVCVADPFSLAGCVELVKRSKAAGIKPLVGVSVQMPDGGWLVLIAKSKAGYQSLSQLVSSCHLEEPRQFPMCTWERLERHSRDVICLTGGDVGPLNRLVTHRRYDGAKRLLDRLVSIFGGGNLFVEIERSYLPWEIEVNRVLLQMAAELGLTPVAGGLVTHARREHFPAQDVLVCAETLCTVDEVIGRKPQRHPSQPQIEPRPERALNAERYLRTPREMAAAFEALADEHLAKMSLRSHESNAPCDPQPPDELALLRNTLLVAERCDDEVLPGRARLPQIFPDPCHALREITYAGAYLRYRQITPRLKRRLEYELERINRLHFADHFLAIWDACRWASDQGIHLSGRGSVVDSAVAYCLGLSRIDALKHNLHFDRFLPADGSKRPDIDIDFEARRRDDVRKYFSDKYGAERVAGIAAIGAYLSRGIIREVGKAMGLPSDVIGFLAKKVHGGIPPDQLESALAKRPELAHSGIPKERFRWVFELSERLMDVPRGMRSHSSGLILSDRPICETAPLMWSASPFVRERIPGETTDDRGASKPDRAWTGDRRSESDGAQTRAEALFPIIQWDKRSAKHFFDKFDILCLRGQDVLSGTQEWVRLRDERYRDASPRGEAMTESTLCSTEALAPRTAARDFSVENLPLDDEETYRAMRSGELIGIPQSASPAMRQAHIRLRTRNLDDASLVQAGIRPGVGGAVKINELIARRRGKPYSFEHPDLEKVLGHTYGIIVFQEQVDQLLQTFCGFTSGEAEDIREAIHKRRREDFGEQMKREILGRVLANGYSDAVAEKVYDYVSGFKGYGFAQGHALAFAEISIRSIYCQQNFPAEYFASLLTAQPAGYYGPCTLVNEARLRGTKVLPPDVNASGVTFGVEDVQSEMDPKVVLPNAGIRVGLMQVRGLSKETRQRIVECRSSVDDAPWENEALASSERGVTGSDSILKGGIVNGSGTLRIGAAPNGIAQDAIPEGASASRFGDRSAFRTHGRPTATAKRESRIATPTPVAHRPTPFASFFDFVARVRPERDELENLILCGALDSLHANRRALLWAIPSAMEYADMRHALSDAPRAAIARKQRQDRHPASDRDRREPAPTRALPLGISEPTIPGDVVDFTDAEKALFERSLLDLDVERHLMAFERKRVASRGGITCAEAKRLPAGRKAIVVGNPIRLRFPPTPSGKRVVFFDLEDETGLLNVTCFDDVYRRDGHAIVCAPYVTIIGVAQDRDGHTAFLAQRVFAYRPIICAETAPEATLPLPTADFLAQ